MKTVFLSLFLGIQMMLNAQVTPPPAPPSPPSPPEPPSMEKKENGDTVKIKLGDRDIFIIERKSEDKKSKKEDDDGIHGATFSSVTMDTNSPATAVQIGDPITQKKLSDAIVKEARDLNLYSSITDNGAGGISCSAAEMPRTS